MRSTAEIRTGSPGCLAARGTGDETAAREALVSETYGSSGRWESLLASTMVLNPCKARQGRRVAGGRASVQ